ncbi:MAG: MraY family glycosyltransferase [Elusimicrobiota bacterium]
MIKLYLTSFFVSLIAVLVFTPFVSRLAKLAGVLDYPGVRRIHTRVVPRWGGVAIFLGVAAGLAVLFFFPQFKKLLAYQYSFTLNKKIVEVLTIDTQFWGILLGGAVVMILGMIDDKKNLPAIIKLLVQIIAALVAMYYGVVVSGLAMPVGKNFVQFPSLISLIFTVIWLVVFMNSINFIDGLDGLAGGVVAIASITFLIVAILQGETKIVFFSKQLKLASLLSAAVGGACLGFLFYNFFPARIFMGDSGSLFLGFMLGVITVIGTLKTTAVIALFVPIIVVGLPLADLIFSVIRRFRNKQPLTQADRQHFHHRLLDLGWTQREIVLLIYILTLLLGVTAILLTVFKGKVI